MEPIAREKNGVRILGTGMTGYALKEPFLIAGDTPVLRKARDAVENYIKTLSDDLFGAKRADVIYLECVLKNSPDATFIAIPRNGIEVLSGPAMANYSPEKIFTISPYYFATNLPRQEAGKSKTTIVKFVRKDR